MRMQRGSFTVEAVIWIPLILSMMIGVLYEGIHFYNICVQHETSEQVKNWDSVSRFYDLWGIKELEEERKDEQSTD